MLDDDEGILTLLIPHNRWPLKQLGQPLVKPHLVLNYIIGGGLNQLMHEMFQLSILD